MSQTPLQPKDYPFYYPHEHKQLINLLEQKAPKAIIALTGSDELSGLSPFPLFDDAAFWFLRLAYMLIHRAGAQIALCEKHFRRTMPYAGIFNRQQEEK